MRRRRGSLKEAKGQASRERILEVAIRLFAHRGYGATSIAAISKRAHIAATAIYWHFGSKEGLLAASLERAATSWTDEIYKRASSAHEASGRLDQLVAGIREMIESQGDELLLLLAVELQERLLGEGVREALRRIDERAVAYLVRGLEETLDRRVPGLDLAAETTLAHLREIALRHRRNPDPALLDRRLQHLKEMIAAAVISAVQHADTPPTDRGESP